MIFIASSFPFPKRAITELSLHNLIWPMTIITYCLIKIDNFSQKNIIYILLFNIQKLSRRIIKTYILWRERSTYEKSIIIYYMHITIDFVFCNLHSIIAVFHNRKNGILFTSTRWNTSNFIVLSCNSDSYCSVRRNDLADC